MNKEEIGTLSKDMDEEGNEETTEEDIDIDIDFNKGRFVWTDEDYDFEGELNYEKKPIKFDFEPKCPMCKAKRLPKYCPICGEELVNMATISVEGNLVRLRHTVECKDCEFETELSYLDIEVDEDELD